jgi:hypothetical protein
MPHIEIKSTAQVVVALYAAKNNKKMITPIKNLNKQIMENCTTPF